MPLKIRPRIDGATPNDRGSPKKRTTVPASVRLEVDFENLDGQDLMIDGRHTSKTHASVAAADLDCLLQADVERAPQEQERAFEPHRGTFNRGTHRAAPIGR